MYDLSDNELKMTVVRKAFRAGVGVAIILPKIFCERNEIEGGSDIVIVVDNEMLTVSKKTTTPKKFTF